MELEKVPVIGAPAENLRRITQSALEVGQRTVRGALQGAFNENDRIDNARFDEMKKWVPVWAVKHLNAHETGVELTKIPQAMEAAARGAAQNYAEHYTRFHKKSHQEKREEYAFRLSVALLVGNIEITDVSIAPEMARAWQTDLRVMVARAEVEVERELLVTQPMVEHLVKPIAALPQKTVVS